MSRPDEFVPDVGTIANISSFGEDNLGNLFIVDLSGEVFEVVPEPPAYALGLLGLAAICLCAWRKRLAAE